MALAGIEGENVKRWHCGWWTGVYPRVLRVRDSQATSAMGPQLVKRTAPKHVVRADGPRRALDGAMGLGARERVRAAVVCNHATKA